jgi:hypothetical protein
MQQGKTIRAMFMGHEIVVHNFWRAGNDEFVTEATLAFNGVVVDRTSELSPKKAKLAATLVDGDNRHAVEVAFGGWFIMRMKIMVDGRKVAGNLR